MFDYIKPLLIEVPDAIMLYIGTNSCVTETWHTTLDKTLKFKINIL